ncbi:coagulation factor 5/8 type domain protein [Beutenbergia cavernae DSM 12333]|uniref:Coagulation factor 5/8 type domain protein n=1 Tax=Beutenbergia cavernae (strain ATCC BAA-8 / DSM 12333 / CCUG 43141 / JCM 11478 / NBRC 16432 / NCIMB 13614 / HKI 0122) TaxID=471853 RepID=C5C207_BEUC1|nr:discoidin domain-containing protein [Beutenbergia cavernae]ACQ81632.1 coagulation factor 5/8 type domain protein [Beutenbergia cavernae DSM 12333]
MRRRIGWVAPVVAGALVVSLAGPAQAEGGFTPEIPESVTALVRPEHPRLIADDDRLVQIQQWVTSDPGAAAVRDELLAEAGAILELPPTEYVFSNGRSLLWAARQVKTRVWTLALAYRLTDDATYAERAYEEMAAAAEFPDWNPESFLSVAEMLNGFAIGYDWLYGYLDEEQRSVVSTAMIEMGLQPAMDGYEAGDGWTTATNNWQIVCVGGIAMASLALADVEPELAESLLQLGLQHVGPAIDEYAPDGGFPEGPMYWRYATRFLVQYVASLESATGTDLGFSDAPGLADTGAFSMNMNGASGRSFNFADASSSYGGPPELYWMAGHYQRPEYAWWADEGLGLSGNDEAADTAAAMVWYGLSERATPGMAGLDQDARYDDVGVVLSRSAWATPTALFTGFRPGNNGGSHGDLDMGTFVLDAWGMRWADELGSDSYSLPGYFGSERWTYYRKRAEGQNTLVVNPGSGPDQSVTATGEVIAQGSSPDGAFTVADLSSAYADRGVETWQRGVAMVDGRSRVIVQDEVEASEPADALWFMHTSADVEIAADGRSAVLTRDGRSLLARIADGPGDAVFSVMAAEPLPTSPNPEGQAANGQSKLTIRVSDAASFRLAVTFDPVVDGVPVPDLPDVTALADWSVRDGGSATLADLRYDGVTVPGFSADTRSLAVETATLGTVEAVASDPSHAVDIQLPDSVPGMATICVDDGADVCATRYRLYLIGQAQGPMTGSIVGTNPTVNAMDGNLGTFWSANGDGQWLRANLPAPTEVSGVRVAWSQGASRIYTFDVETSTDGETWSTVWQGTSSGTTLEMEDVTFDPVTARYVRIVSHGNSANTWMSLSELRVVTADGVWPEVSTEPVPTALTLDAAATMSVQSAQAVTAAVVLSDGTTVEPDGTVEVSSSDPGVVQVVGDLLVARSTGVATVVAWWRAASGQLLHASVEITVEDPGTSTLLATQDAFVRDGTYADETYGSRDTLTIKGVAADDTGYEREAFIAFDLPHPEAELVSAELVLTTYVAEGRTMAVDLFSAAAGWDEHALTWNTRPAVGDRLGGFTAGETSAQVALSVTDAVAAALDDGAVGFALRQDVNDTQAFGATVMAHEAGAASPTLNLTWALPQACEEPVTGDVTGPLQLSGPSACLVGADVGGPVTVAPGTAFSMSGSSIDGPLFAAGAALVTVQDSTVSGPVTVSGPGATWWENVTVTGPVSLASDDTVVLIDSSIEGPLSCGPGVSALIDTTVTGPANGCG